MTASRGMPFFTLLEAVGQPGCPLCRLCAQQTRRYLEHLLYESVNDTAFRETWRKSRGFCHRHTWLFAESANALGLGILYLDLIEHHGPQLLTTPPAKSCAACEQERLALHEHLDVLVEHWDDPELRQAIAASGGLCGPHLRAALRVVRPREVRRTLETLSTQGLEQLIPQLRTLIESFDYQHAPAREEQVRNAWRHAINKIVGQPGLSDDART